MFYGSLGNLKAIMNKEPESNLLSNKKLKTFSVIFFHYIYIDEY